MINLEHKNFRLQLLRLLKTFFKSLNEVTFLSTKLIKFCEKHGTEQRFLTEILVFEANKINNPSTRENNDRSFLISCNLKRSQLNLIE